MEIGFHKQMAYIYGNCKCNQKNIPFIVVASAEWIFTEKLPTLLVVANFLCLEWNCYCCYFVAAAATATVAAADVSVVSYDFFFVGLA